MVRKKNVKMRGTKTHGYGSKKKHRGAGSRGGRGYAGSLKHKKFWIFKNEPNHIGSRGFRSLKQKGFSSAKKSIGLRDLVGLTNDTEIDVTKFGYQKVIGTGQITQVLTIKANQFSKIAKEKIEKAKGKAVEV
ncbi:MAG: uL15 family ribosomal protein [Candidatus Aenigmatarchaeota archaeon]